ncbi:hypothetical protein CEXT_621681 [Caerostris extrusa]|uniref:Uncharacterized protein n=1 Tax=Caerostris extrusa TaxID=172846 RepID=A0AAV4V781_CAEEX|nr:hypothetical protein CEXT_621681 [Caerostris extrusa]
MCQQSRELTLKLFVLKRMEEINKIAFSRYLTMPPEIPNAQAFRAHLFFGNHVDAPTYEAGLVPPCWIGRRRRKKLKRTQMHLTQCGKL